MAYSEVTRYTRTSTANRGGARPPEIEGTAGIAGGARFEDGNSLIRSLRFRGWRARAAAGLFALLTASAGLAATAQAAPSTKYYTAIVSPVSVSSNVSQQAFTLTLTNCGSRTPSCSQVSHQSLGSADIQVDPAFGNVSVSLSASDSASGWFIVQPVSGGLVELRSSGTSLTPGASIAISVVANTPASAGAYTWTTAVKQSNDFSGTGNDFALLGSQPQVLVGFPDHLRFVAQPSTVQATTGSSTSYMCPAPSVQVVAADGTPVTSGSADVTLAADTASGDPGLGGTTTVSTTSGLATFGVSPPPCGSGVDALNVGTGYRLKATATWTLGAYRISLTTSQDSAAFDVVQLLTTCAAGSSCSGSVSGHHVTAGVFASQAASLDQLEIAVGIDSLAGTTCTPPYQPQGLEVTRVVLDHRDKIVTLTFDKYLVNQVPKNGTPFASICFSAPWGDWVTDTGVPPTLNGDQYEGILPDCTAALLAPYNPCVSGRSKQAANEIVRVSIPYETGRADPKLW